ncbi:MAG: lamin tail domain-containing protein [Verrucomicrobiota bacterium]
MKTSPSLIKGFLTLGLAVLAGGTPLQAAVTPAHQTLTTPFQADKAIVLAATAVPAAPLTYAISRPPAHGQLTGTPPNVTYRPDPGYLGLDNFAFTATDGSTVSSPGGVSITVTPDVPAAADAGVSTGFNQPAVITLSATDPDGEVLTYSIVTQPVSGTLSGAGGTWTYTPNAGFSGADSFTFKASDGTFSSNTATVRIAVNAAPSAPAGAVLSDDKILTSDVPGSFIARLQASDPNFGETHTFELVAGAGDTGNALVKISGNQLIADSSFAASLGRNISFRIKITDSTGRSTEQALVLPVNSPKRDIVINEIQYNPARNEIPAEFVELYNPLASAVDVSGWKLDGGVSYTIPAGVTIPAGGYLVIAQDPAAMLGLYGVTALGPWSSNLSSDGEDLQLRNAGNNVVDELVYGVVSPWPSASNGDGASMEKIHPLLDGRLGSNWRASTAAATAFSWLPLSSTGWKYRKGSTANGEPSTPREAWRAKGFTEDATWLTGQTPIGSPMLGNTSIETGITSLRTSLSDMNSGSATYKSLTLRKTFTVTGPLPKSVLLKVLHNDAAIVWINGREVVRLSIRAGDKAYNTTDYYEHGNDPWTETVIANADQLFVEGDNVIAIQAFAKPPQLRGGDDATAYGNHDFAIDASLTQVPDGLPTPGAQNSVFSENAAPAVRDVVTIPTAPAGGEAVTVTAHVTDPQGVQSVELLYQIVAPGSFIPAKLPLTAAQLLANPLQNRTDNPAFELAANWITVPMTDNGGAAGDTGGDAIYRAVIPGQPHRTLVRYRIRVTDPAGNTARLPYADDPARNWAYFSYNGVPDYVTGTKTFPSAQLTTVPVYHFIMRETDRLTLMAYNGTEQMENSIRLNALRARRTENWEAAIVYDGKVYDHINTRLRGGNSRYMGSAKRHLRINFNKGYGFEARDEKGRAMPVKWDAMLVNKMFGNKGYMSWGMEQEVGGNLWKLNGVPVPESHWFHMRMIRGAAEAPAATTGDFYGLFQAIEFVDKRFLEARGMEKGNVYKLSDWTQNGEMLDRYGAPGAAQFGEDYDNFRYNIHGAASEDFMKTYVNMPLWYRYNAVQEAIRHYDIFTEPTGRHRMKNMILYFEPMAGTNGLGRALVMPYDWDASFGPSWNSGQDTVRNGIYNFNTFPDSPTWGAIAARPTLKIEHRNVLREFRDLIWQEDQVNPMIDAALATISGIWPAERARWSASGAQGDHAQGPVFKAQNMKEFAFTNWTDPFNGDPSVPGGRDAYLDSIVDSGDAGQLPVKPVITYTGDANYPLDGLRFTASAFSDPQGAADFAGIQWRVGEITDPAAPVYDPGDDRVYEGAAVWDSTTLTAQNTAVSIPASALKSGRTYRARVRYRDLSGRYSHWSAPVPFTTSGADALTDLRKILIISEFMYKPADPTPAQAALGYEAADFEFIELHNLSATKTLDLTNVRFTKGIDFDLASGTPLAPGGYLVIAKNAAAFASRYPAAAPAAGSWGSQSLSNSGEQLKLSFGSGSAIRDFVYSPDTPWPQAAGNGGVSLIYTGAAPVDEVTDPQLVPENWSASSTPGGTPGSGEPAGGASFSAWMTQHGFTDPAADPDEDGYNNLAAFALAIDLGAPAATPGWSAEAGGPYLTLTYTRRRGVSDVTFKHQLSTGLGDWTDTDTTPVETVPQPDGTERLTFRSTQPWTARGRCFLRVKMTAP